MQLPLVVSEGPSFDPAALSLRRVTLGGGAWLEHAPGFLSGERILFDELRRTMAWREQERRMYERVVKVPRLFASVPDDGPGHPLLVDIASWLGERYNTSFASISMALYRDGNDSVAWHGDKVLRDRPAAFVVTLSLGEPRAFVLRPVGGGPRKSFSLGCGDLMVMGGSCQRGWEHAVPKVAHAYPRLCVMFREDRLDPDYAAKRFSLVGQAKVRSRP